MGEYNNNFRMQKTAVQTLNESMKKKGIMPQYECIHDGTQTGDGLFTYRVTCGEYEAIGSGGSKKDARQVAAMKMLYQINEGDELLPDKINGNSAKENGHFDNAVGVLQMLCSRKRLPCPQYELIDQSGPNHAKTFTIECRVLTFKERGTGRMKQAAKHESARKIISLLSESEEITKNSCKQKEEEISNVDGIEGNSRNNEGAKMPEKGQKREDDGKIKANVIPAQNSNSAELQNLPQVPNGRVETIPIPEIPQSQRNPTKKVKLPTGNLVFQRKYIARKLNDVKMKLKECNDNTRDFVDGIFAELQKILQLREVEASQSFVAISNGKFMLSIYIPTDPQIIDVAVDDDEIYLKKFLYERVIDVLLDLINRY